MSAWTAGPWRVSKPHELEGVNIIAGRSDFVAVLSDEQAVCLVGRFDAEDIRADANLIAAAPDLYEALQSMLTFYGMDREKGEVSDVIHGEAEKALAKARGES